MCPCFFLKYGFGSCKLSKGLGDRGVGMRPRSPPLARERQYLSVSPYRVRTAVVVEGNFASLSHLIDYYSRISVESARVAGNECYFYLQHLCTCDYANIWRDVIDHYWLYIHCSVIQTCCFIIMWHVLSFFGAVFDCCAFGFESCSISTHVLKCWTAIFGDSQSVRIYDWKFANISSIKVSNIYVFMAVTNFFIDDKVPMSKYAFNTYICVISLSEKYVILIAFHFTFQ